MKLSLVEHLLWEQAVVSSNLIIPTTGVTVHTTTTKYRQYSQEDNPAAQRRPHSCCESATARLCRIHSSEKRRIQTLRPGRPVVHPGFGRAAQQGVGRQQQESLSGIWPSLVQGAALGERRSGVQIPLSRRCRSPQV